MVFLKMLKGLFFHQTEKDATEISNAVFKLDEFENLLGVESYFQKQIGKTGHCLTPEDIVFLVYSNEKDSHLQECPDCNNMYQTLMEGEIIVAQRAVQTPQPIASNKPSRLEKFKKLALASRKER